MPAGQPSESWSDESESHSASSSACASFFLAAPPRLLLEAAFDDLVPLILDVSGV